MSDSERTPLPFVGGGIWRLQVNSAPGYCGPTHHHTGVEVATKAVHQHVTAEGICR